MKIKHQAEFYKQGTLCAQMNGAERWPFEKNSKFGKYLKGVVAHDILYENHHLFKKIPYERQDKIKEHIYDNYIEPFLEDGMHSGKHKVKKGQLSDAIYNIASENNGSIELSTDDNKNIDWMLEAADHFMRGYTDHIHGRVANINAMKRVR